MCWVSAEGTTERDYLGMAVFKDAQVSVKFPKNTHPNRHNPAAVLKRFEKALRENDFRAGDEAWLVVDVDDWDEDEFEELLAWKVADDRHHLAVSNPKFELFLVMHFEKANGCTTPEKVDSALKKHLPRYAKRVSTMQFSAKQVHDAIANAKAKRVSCKAVLPAPGMTDAYLLVESIMR
uniref:RloB domain-containing protein n=1 Tax=Collinsella aerofaciens TaxID=74426 RepID=UPI003BA9B617